MEKPHDPKRRRRFRVITILCFVAIIGLDAVIFSHWLGASYFAWAIGLGPYMALASAVLGVAWQDMDKHLGLVAADPLEYIGSWFQVVGLPIFAVGTHLRSESRGGGVSRWDSFWVLPMELVLIASILAYGLLVIPLQYFVFLFAGVPARFFATSTAQVSARVSGTSVEATAGTAAAQQAAGGQAWDASLVGKPLVLTSALGGVVLAIASLLLPETFASS